MIANRNTPGIAGAGPVAPLSGRPAHQKGKSGERRTGRLGRFFPPRFAARMAVILAAVLPVTLGMVPAEAASPPGFGQVPFKDVPGNFWAANAINFLSAKGILQGYPGGNFRPDALMTRAQFVTALVRMTNMYLTTKGAPAFRDVAAGSWYYNAVEEAAVAGWVHGSGGYFDPGAPLTRQEAAAILAQYLDLGGMVQTAAGNPPLPLDFQDAATVAPYAVGALAACQDAGLIQGFPGGTVGPNLPVTRAEAAAMLDRLEGITPQTAASAAGGNLRLGYAFTGNANYLYNLNWGGSSSQVDLQEAGAIWPGNATLSNLQVTATEYWQVNGQKTQVAQAATNLTISGQGRITGGLGTAKGASLAGILGGQGAPWVPSWDLVIPLPKGLVSWGDTWTAQSTYNPAVNTTYTYLGIAVWQGKPTAVIRIQSAIAGTDGASPGQLSGLAGVRPSDGKLRYVEVQGSQGSTTFRATGAEAPYSPPAF